jgi:hypothetical protein
MNGGKEEFFKKYNNLTDKEYNLELMYSLQRTRYKLEKIKMRLSLVVSLIIACLLLLIFKLYF